MASDDAEDVAGEVELSLDRGVYIGIAAVVGVFMLGLFLVSGGLPGTGHVVNAGDADPAGTVDDDTTDTGGSDTDTENAAGTKDTGVEPSDLMLVEQHVPENYVMHDEGQVLSEDIESDTAKDLFVEGYYTFRGKPMNVQQGIQQTVFVTDPEADAAEDDLGINDYLEEFNWTEQNVSAVTELAVEDAEFWYNADEDLYFVYLRDRYVHVELVVTDPDMSQEDVVELAEHAADRMM